MKLFNHKMSSPRDARYHTPHRAFLSRGNARVRVVVPVKRVQPAVFAHDAFVTKKMSTFTHGDVRIADNRFLVHFDERRCAKIDFVVRDGKCGDLPGCAEIFRES